MVSDHLYKNKTNKHKLKLSKLVIARIKNIARQKGYLIFKELYKLNIWGVRSTNETPNKFDDELHVFFKVPVGKTSLTKWEHFVFKCTTDPGTYWLKNPMSPKGTAMLAPNQYVNAYKIDKHRGKYYALCQRNAKVEVIRDYNRNSILDFYNGIKEKGMFGINIHRARKTGITYEIENHSAGCQVFQSALDFQLFMSLCEMHKKVHGNKFTYTLIDKRIELRETLKRTAIGLMGASVLLTAYWLLSDENED